MPVVILHTRVLPQVLQYLSYLFRVSKPFNLGQQLTCWSVRVLEISYRTLHPYRSGAPSFFRRSRYPVEKERSFTRNEAVVTGIHPSGGGAGSALSIETFSRIPLGISIIFVFSPTLMTRNGPADTARVFGGGLSSLMTSQL